MQPHGREMDGCHGNGDYDELPTVIVAKLLGSLFYFPVLGDEEPGAVSILGCPSAQVDDDMPQSPRPLIFRSLPSTVGYRHSRRT